MSGTAGDIVARFNIILDTLPIARVLAGQLPDALFDIALVANALTRIVQTPAPSARQPPASRASLLKRWV